jgi:hypothetical protein
MAIYDRNHRRKARFFNKEGASFSGFLDETVCKETIQTEPESQQAKPESFFFTVPGNQSKAPERWSYTVHTKI